jgi:thymidylate kinase
MGKLIIVEGVDGSGKSTLIEKLKQYFGDRAYVINYSYPTHGLDMFQKAAEAYGQYEASIKIFKEILTKNPRAIIICDRFHLGEYAYGIVKRDYPIWLAEEIFTIEDRLISEIGRENVLLVILTVVEPKEAYDRTANRVGEYLKGLGEYIAIVARYLVAYTKTKLEVLVYHTDMSKNTPEYICSEILNTIGDFELDHL